MIPRFLAAVLCCGGFCACSLLNPLGYLQGGERDGGADSAADGTADGAPPCSPAAAPAHLTDAVAISASGSNTCALRKGGQVVCWGDNKTGQTGSTVSGPTLAPATVQVPMSGGPVVALAAGPNHACAVDSRGAVWCWGVGAYGQLGTSVSFGDFGSYPLPRRIEAGDGGAFSAEGRASAGGNFSCVVALDGKVACWGLVDFGAVGVDPASNSDVDVPSDLPMTGGASTLSSGSTHSCAIVAGGALCWGSGESGELGAASSMSCPGAASCSWSGVLAILPPTFAGPVKSLAAGGASAADYTCAVDSRGEVFCWGAYGAGQTGDTSYAVIGPTLPPGPHRVVGLPDGGTSVAVAAGAATTCVLGRDGDVRCFGANGSGQLGQGTFDLPDDAGQSPAHASPVPVPGIAGATAVTVGADHACAIADCGAVWCWGRNGSGQLGNGTTQDSPIPVRVAAPTP